MEDKLFLKKEEHFLYVNKVKEKDSVRFDLQAGSLERKNDKDIWEKVEHSYMFFKGYGVHHLDADPKFKELIVLSMKYNDNCRSLSTFISRLPDFFVYEGFIIEGIKAIPYRGYRKDDLRHITKKLSDYDKTTLKLVKELDLTVNPDFERAYFGTNPNGYYNRPKLFRELLHTIYLLKLQSIKKLELVNLVSNRLRELESLVTDYKYNPTALFEYIVNYLEPFENIEPTDAIELLNDYYRMANTIGRNVKKYPKYLRSMHDIISANYNSYKEHYDEVLFRNVQKPELEYKSGDYCIIIPKSSKDIISEGTSLNHCVSSYVNKILEKETLIVFLRKTKAPR